MEVKQHVSYNGNEIYISDELKDIMDKNLIMSTCLRNILTLKNCCDGVVPITELNQLIETIFVSIDVFGNDYRFAANDLKWPNAVFILMDIEDVLKNEKYAQGLIPKDFASKFLKKIIAIYQEKAFKDYEEFKTIYYKQINILFNYLKKDELVVSDDDYDKLIESLDSNEDILMTIPKLNINKIKSFDEEKKKKMTLLVEQIFEKIKDKSYYSLFVELLFNPNFINGRIKEEQLNMLIELLETGLHVNEFFKILSSENFGRGIIDDSYLNQIISWNKEIHNVDNFIRARVLTELLTSEYYGLGLVTKENIDLIVSDEYKVITGMIYYFVNKNSELSLEEKYNWVLGIFQIENKQEMCRKLERLGTKNGGSSICDIGTSYAQFNLMAPKFDITPTDVKGKK